MSLLRRIANLLRGERLVREIDEELESHLQEAAAQGRNPADARRALGSSLRLREESRDIKLVAWLDSLHADAIFGWRQLAKKKVSSAAAILSLALAIGACTSAFRLIDALLLRPLPVAHPEQLYFLSHQGIGPEGKPQSFDGWAFPSFVLMRAAVKGQAELLAISYDERADLTFGADDAMEKAHLQYVSGRTFGSFGLRPALGRLLSENDDLQPGAHPYAVLSYDYWTRRFAQDPKIIGRAFRLGGAVYEIVGVSDERFTGTEPGTVTDVFLPTMMHPKVTRPDATWVRAIARLEPGVAIEPLRQKLEATSRAFELERSKGFTGMSPQRIANFVNQTLVLQSAAAGVSFMQNDYRRSLLALGVLVLLVLLIACANVANLMTAQAAARGREMALRVSIGAGRWRLMQLVLVESAWLASLAAAAGGLFAWWSAPFVVGRISPADNPTRLVLPADWRVFGFGLVLTLGVTLLFGLVPALRVSGIQPVSALKGGEDPHSRGRLMHSLVAVQVAFCFLVLFVAGLFVATLDRLSHQSTGFSDERLLVLDTLTQRPQVPVFWYQLAGQLRAVPGVETVALGDWTLMNGNSSNNEISTNGTATSDSLSYFRQISPGWLDTMRIPLLDGRDFRPGDHSPGAAIVNQTFARLYFNGETPVGKWFSTTRYGARFQIVGMVRDVRYRSLREPILPLAFVPFQSLDTSGAVQAVGQGTFLVRTATKNPLALAQTLRREVARAGLGFRVRNINTQEALDLRQTIRERLLATLAMFFAAVALLLACIGLYGVLDYSVLQRRREIGIRMAIGARPAGIVRLVTVELFSMVLAGALIGLALGSVAARSIQALLYQVQPTGLAMLSFPLASLLLASMLAALPAIIRAVRIDPVKMLRME